MVAFMSPLDNAKFVKIVIPYTCSAGNLDRVIHNLFADLNVCISDLLI